MCRAWSGWRMAGLVQLPVNGSWIMWEHSWDGWADFPVVISMYELIDSLAWATHSSAEQAGFGSVLHSAHTHSCSAQNSMGNIFYHHLLKCFNHRINSPRILSQLYDTTPPSRMFIAFPPRLAKITKGLLAKPRYSFSAHMSGICQFSTVNVTRPCP